MSHGNRVEGSKIWKVGGSNRSLDQSPLSVINMALTCIIAAAKVVKGEQLLTWLIAGTVVFDESYRRYDFRNRRPIQPAQESGR